MNSEVTSRLMQQQMLVYNDSFNSTPF